MSKFRYPIDTDQFHEIRENGLFYVDKTDLIYDLVSDYTYIFLTRPHGFGKSLLCNTIEAYYQGKKDLFQGLKIMDLETDWSPYPVLHFNMSALSHCTTLQSLKEEIGSMLSVYEKQYDVKVPEFDILSCRFDNLIQWLHEIMQKRVVVIVEDYDTPLLQNLFDDEIRTQFGRLLGGFYETLKYDGDHIEFVILTGTSPYSLNGIGSGFNNMSDISMSRDYACICGITQAELDTVMRPCVEEYAQALGIATADAYALLRKYYGVYHFSNECEDVYSPCSIFSALSRKDTGSYWFESCSSKALSEHLNHFPKQNPFEYDGIMVSSDVFTHVLEDADSLVPFLYQNGYLTIDTYDRDLRSYVIKIPNLEVRNGLVDSLVPMILKRNMDDNNTLVAEMTETLLDGNLSGAIYALLKYNSKIPFDSITLDGWQDETKRASFYDKLLRIVFSMLRTNVDNVVDSVFWRNGTDVVIATETHVFAMKFIVDKYANEALAMIDNDRYFIPYEVGGRILQKCGVMISSNSRNITHWVITDVNGKLVDEQMHCKL